MTRDDDDADGAGDGERQLHQAREQDHAPADDPDDARHLVVREIEVERPCKTAERQLEKDQPGAADEKKPRKVIMLAAVEEGAGSGQKKERRRAKVRHLAGEENAQRGAAGRQT